jgi:hypothetical protein
MHVPWKITCNKCGLFQVAASDLSLDDGEMSKLDRDNQLHFKKTQKPRKTMKEHNCSQPESVGSFPLVLVSDAYYKGKACIYNRGH